MGKEGKQGKRRRSAEATRKIVMTVLASQPETEPGPCPAPEVMAAFSAGRLSEQERRQVFEHLARCPDCYREWLAVTAVVGKRSGAKRWVWAGSGIAAVMLGIVLFLIWPGGPDREVERAMGKITEHLQAMRQSGELPEVAMMLPGATRGRAPTEREKAFRAGMLVGQRELDGNGESLLLPTGLEPKDAAPGTPATIWAKQGQAPFYWLGRWTFAAREICRATGEVSGEERRLLLVAAQELRKEITAQTGTDVKPGLVTQTLRDIVEVLSTEGSQTDCKKLTKLQGSLESGLMQ